MGFGAAIPRRVAAALQLSAGGGQGAAQLPGNRIYAVVLLLQAGKTDAVFRLKLAMV